MNNEAIFKFLDSLRESGQMNMFGAPKVLREAFGLTKSESFEAFKAWTDNFSNVEMEKRNA